MMTAYKKIRNIVSPHDDYTLKHLRVLLSLWGQIDSDEPATGNLIDAVHKSLGGTPLCDLVSLGEECRTVESLDKSPGATVKIIDDILQERSQVRRTVRGPTEAQ